MSRRKTPKAPAWQAPTCLAVAKVKEERSTSSAEVRSSWLRVNQEVNLLGQLIGGSTTNFFGQLQDVMLEVEN